MASAESRLRVSSEATQIHIRTRGEFPSDESPTASECLPRVCMTTGRTRAKRNMSVRTPIEGLASIENGGDVIDYLLDSEGLNYSTFVEAPSGIQRNQGRNDWYEAHLVDENGDAVIRYIELEAVRHFEQVLNHVPERVLGRI